MNIQKALVHLIYKKVFLQEATKRIIQANPANWCSSENCNLEIFQDGKTVLVSSSDGEFQ